MRDAPTPPVATVAIAAYNCAQYLGTAVASALSQTVADIEVIIVDDKSTDGTLAFAQALAATDPRVHVIAQEHNGGPAAARNAALAAAKGTWIAVLDSDDIYLPDRIATLLDAAARTGADVVADNLVCFANTDFADGSAFIPSEKAGRWIDLAAYLTGTRLFGSVSDLGYLKPMIRCASIRAHGIAYRPTLRIGEDDDLVLRMLDAGLRYWYEPSLTYAYRRHDHSISHRLSAANAAEMAEAIGDLCQHVRTKDCMSALKKRQRVLARKRDFALMVDAVKARDYLAALCLGLGRPAILVMWREAVANRISSRLPFRRHDQNKLQCESRSAFKLAEARHRLLALYGMHPLSELGVNATDRPEAVQQRAYSFVSSKLTSIESLHDIKR